MPFSELGEEHLKYMYRQAEKKNKKYMYSTGHFKEARDKSTECYATSEVLIIHVPFRG